MKRNLGVDITRAFAIMAVIVYHFYVLVDGNRYLSHPLIHRLISIGGEVGVTLFFIISGYGIYLSIDRRMQRGDFSTGTFLKKRFARVLPQYYLSLLIIIFIGTQGAVLSNSGIFDIVTHVLLIHNFFPSTCGSISTVLWTMGVIFQFYFVSILLYKWVKKKPVIALICSIVFTILCKIIIFHIVFPHVEVEPSYYFTYGRQLFTALDNFIVGMFLANYNLKPKELSIGSKMILGSLMCVLVVAWCVMPQANLRYSDSFMGYIWNTVLACLLGVCMWVISNIRFNNSNIFMRLILFVSEYQYGIYLWHFVVAANLLQNSSWIIKIANESFMLVAIVLSLICILVGYISTITLEAPDYFKIRNSK